ncbi:MAG: hypothetical protein HUJ29_12960 [Gammaproteobacteria bacterium]|nr:hypothetical protein [Gammaproteobacteria bacterium]
MSKLKLSPHLTKKTNWVSGNHYDEMDRLDHISLEENGRIVAVFTDQTTMDVSDLFPLEIITSYRSHDILIHC